jgi:anti-anti-sigma factor
VALDIRHTLLVVTYEVSTGSDGTVTITVGGELDTHTVPALEAALAPTITSLPDRVVVETSALEFADSSAIALFVRWAKQARELEIRDAPAPLRRRLLQMGLGDRLRIGPLPETPEPEAAA